MFKRRSESGLIKRRKKQFLAFLLTLMVALTSMSPAVVFAKVYTIDTVAKLTGFKDTYLYGGDKIRLSDGLGIYYSGGGVVYYYNKDKNPEDTVTPPAADKTVNGDPVTGYYEFTIDEYNDTHPAYVAGAGVVGWKVTGVKNNGNDPNPIFRIKAVEGATITYYLPNSNDPVEKEFFAPNTGDKNPVNGNNYKPADCTFAGWYDNNSTMVTR